MEAVQAEVESDIRKADQTIETIDENSTETEIQKAQSLIENVRIKANTLVENLTTQIKTLKTNLSSLQGRIKLIDTTMMKLNKRAT
ncbi:hypothetical protein KKH82_00015 [Patescibacteria group bacterium]|nr:hypothetical protein [Patescibacteria group bacterium]